MRRLSGGGMALVGSHSTLVDRRSPLVLRACFPTHVVEISVYHRRPPHRRLTAAHVVAEKASHRARPDAAGGL